METFPENKHIALSLHEFTNDANLVYSKPESKHIPAFDSNVHFEVL